MLEVRRTAVGPLAVLAGGAAGLAWLSVQDPHEPGHLFPRCPFRLLTGLQCPACGGTRVAYDVLHGDLGAAWRDNALLLVLAPFALLLLGRWIVAGLRGQTFRVVLSPRGTALVLATAAVWTVARNLA